MKFGWPEPTQKKWLTFINFHWSERPRTQLIRVPPDEILVFLTNLFFSAKRDKKHTVLFQTHICEKSSFFQRACTCICTDIRKYMTGVQICRRFWTTASHWPTHLLIILPLPWSFPGGQFSKTLVLVRLHLSSLCAVCMYCPPEKQKSSVPARQFTFIYSPLWLTFRLDKSRPLNSL